MKTIELEISATPPDFTAYYECDGKEMHIHGMFGIEYDIPKGSRLVAVHLLVADKCKTSVEVGEATRVVRLGELDGDPLLCDNLNTEA